EAAGLPGEPIADAIAPRARRRDAQHEPAKDYVVIFGLPASDRQRCDALVSQVFLRHPGLPVRICLTADDTLMTRQPQTMLTQSGNLWQEKRRRIRRQYWSESSWVNRPEPIWNELEPAKKTIANLLCGVNLHRGFESPPLRQVIPSIVPGPPDLRQDLPRPPTSRAPSPYPPA